MNVLRNIAVCCLIGISSSFALVLIEKNRSDYVIVIAEQPSPSVRHAAEELQHFLREMTGVTLAIRPDSEPATAHEILLGDNRRLQQLGVSVPFQELGDEGYVLRTAGDRLIIAGSAVRGTLYGVYGLLEDHLDCRWYTPAVSRIPKLKRLVLQDLNERKVPLLEYREPFVFDCFDGDWCCRNRMNSSAGRLEEKHGGKIRFGEGMFVHTFNTLAPPDRYFDQHPEYFSEINGKRLRDHTQLCCTNPDVVALVTDQVLQAIRRDSQAFVFSVSQNDWYNYCECATCSALAEKEGTQAAPLLHLVNRVAEAVEKEFPDKAIETLAYQYTRKPPKTMRPRPNVIIRLCTIECSFSEPLDSGYPPNRAFKEDIEGWARVCDRLWIWDYTTSFAHYLTPFPNLRILDDNIRFFIKNHVRGIFEEDAYQSPGSELAPLIGYMMAKFLWNPDYDENRAMDEFLQAVYGAAGRPIRRYIDLIHDQAMQDSAHVTIGAGPFERFLSDKVLLHAERLWQKAEAAVKNNPQKLVQVRVARMSNDYVHLERARAIGKDVYRIDHRRYQLQPNPDFAARLQRFKETAAQIGLTHVREGGENYGEWVRQLDSLQQSSGARLTVRQPVALQKPAPGLAFVYSEGPFDRIPDFSQATPVKSGWIDSFTLNAADREVHFALKFSGYIQAPADGVYQFSMRSNDGGRLYIGEELVVDNEHLYGERQGCGVIALKAGFHPITVTFFQQLGGRLLEVGWQGPGIPWRIIPAAAVWHEE